MKHENLAAWLEGDPNSLRNYDFVEDTQELSEEILDYGEIKDVYEKFFLYKFNTTKPKDRPNWKILENIEDPALRNEFLSNQEKFLEKAEKCRGIDDPDSASSLLQEVYRKLWPDLANRSFMTCKDRIYSDTMTSAMTRFTDAMRLFLNGTYPGKEDLPAEKADVWYEVIEKIRSIHKAGGDNQKWWSTNFSVIVIACLSEEDRKTLDELIESRYPALPRFLDRCHRIGNYCPVPGGFNSARSGSYADHDYWDLTLMKIREWYLAADKMSMYERDRLLVEDLLHNSGNALFCMRWLECFGQGEIGWHNFVNTLFLQDYVEKETYEVKPFWTGHGWGENESIGLPTGSMEEVNEGLQEIWERIDRRSGVMIERLKDSKLCIGLSDIADGYEVINWTSEESRCYEFKILLCENQKILDDDIILIKTLNGTRMDLRIFVSTIFPYYYMFVEKTNYIESGNKWQFITVEELDEKTENLMKKIESYMEHRNYKKLTSEVVKTIVPGIETEIKELGSVTVFDCLFTDMVDIM